MVTLRRQEPKRDWIAWLVALCAAIASVVAYAITAKHGGVVLYKDAVSHLEIARRVVDSTDSPSLAQLGVVWLPLPHILTLPLVWVDSLYYSGFAGAVVSMLAYVVTTVLVYKTVYRLTDSKLAGVVSAVVFAANINMLYMQSTAMTEALLFATVMGMVYCIQQWADTGRYQYLVGGGVAGLLASLSRYEAWPILFVLSATVVVIAWQRSRSRVIEQLAEDEKPDRRQIRAAVLDRTIAFGMAGFAGIVIWCLWGWTIFGNPLAFQTGEYAKPSLWVNKGDISVGDWWISIKTYWFATLDNVPWPLLLVAVIGLGFFLVRELRTKHTVVRALPVLSLLVMVPFFVLCLYTGQRPLHVTQVWGGDADYNVRYGLVMLLPAAIFIGYLVGGFRKWLKVSAYVASLSVVTAVVLFSALLLNQGNVATYNEAAAGLKSQAIQDQRAVGAFLKANYQGGLVLMESFGNEDIAFQAVPSSQLLYEGSYQKWEPALRDPAGRHIQWIIARKGSTPDKVSNSLTPAVLTSYGEVFRTANGDYTVYRRK